MPRRVQKGLVRAAGLVIGLSIVVLPAQAASGGLPHPKSTLVVLNQSIGGVSVGMPVRAAKAAWGPGAVCTRLPRGNGRCAWKGPGQPGIAIIRYMTVNNVRKVETVIITAGWVTHANYPRAYTGPLAKWTLNGSVHLGTGINELYKAVPNLVNGPDSPQAGGGGPHTMTFGFTDNGHNSAYTTGSGYLWTIRFGET